MAQRMRTTWQDFLDYAAAREREAEFSRSAVVREFYNPYWDVVDVEYVLLEASQQILREISGPMVQSIGGAAVEVLELNSGIGLDLDVVTVLAASLRIGATGNFVPCMKKGVRAWYQTLSTPPEITPAYVLMEGKVYHNGDKLRLVTLREPNLAEFRGNRVSLPTSGFEEEVADRVHHWLNIMDFMQGGRI